MTIVCMSGRPEKLISRVRKLGRACSLSQVVFSYWHLCLFMTLSLTGRVVRDSMRSGVIALDFSFIFDFIDLK